MLELSVLGKSQAATVQLSAGEDRAPLSFLIQSVEVYSKTTEVFRHSIR
jgi:hypothetical protein